MSYKNLFFSLLISVTALGVTPNQVWRVPNGQKVPSWGPINLSDGTNAVTGLLPKANKSITAYAKSSGSGSYVLNSPTLTDVTNLNVSLTTTGRPVHIQMVGASSTSGGIFCENGSNRACYVNILRGSTTIAQNVLKQGQYMGCGSIAAIDKPVAGTYTYKIQVAHVDAAYGRQIYITNCSLAAWEL